MRRFKQSVQRELKQQYDSLNTIEEKIALYTELEAPLHLLNQRKHVNERIEELEHLLRTGDLPDETEPTETSFVRVSNIPPLPPHYVHREAELATLRNLLLSKEHHIGISALRGMGGIGKTTLAIALCHDQQVIDAFPGGTLWATLGPKANILSAQAAWGAVLNEDLTGLPDAEARASRLRSLLNDKRCLLVIDDVWDTAHLPLMQVGGPQCATLVTTRERKIAQKVGLAHDLDVLEPQQAVKLLGHWAGEIAEDERSVAGELARRLGYLPLALALAGAQAHDGENWADLLAVFRDVQGADITLLDLDDPTVRDESLSLAFDLSVERLGEALPDHFASLGVFAAGREAPFSAEAAAAVWEVKPIKARKTLGRLVRAALLDKEDDNYSLHLLLGDYARSRLGKTERQSAEKHHRVYYLEVAKRSKKEWRTAEAALPQMMMAWSRIDENDVESLAEWIRVTSAFILKRGLHSYRVTWGQAALAAAITSNRRGIEAKCRLYISLAFLFLNKLDEAMEQCRISLEFSREINSRRLEASASGMLGRVHSARGEWEEARRCYQTRLDISREIVDRQEEAWALNSLGTIHGRRQEPVEAIEYYQASLAIMREIDDSQGEALLLSNIANNYGRLNKPEEALEYFKQALSIQQEIGDRSNEVTSLNGIGRMFIQLRQLSEALEYLEAGLILAREINERSGEASALQGIGRIYRFQGHDLAKALAYLQASLAINRDLGNQVGEAFLLWNIGLTYEDLHQFVEAEKHLIEAVSLFEATDLFYAKNVREDLTRVREKIKAI